MAKRDFFILMIKLFGLYSVVTTLFSGLPSSIAFSFSFGHFDISTIIWIVAAVVITLGLFWLLTFKADKLVDLLKLENGFKDDRIELGNIKAEDIIKTGIFIIGGLLIIKSVPGLLSQIFWAIKGDIVRQEFTQKDKFNLAISILNVLLGYLLFTNYDVIAKRLKIKKDPD